MQSCTKASISQLGLYSLRGASLTPAPEIKTVFPSQAGNQQPVTISISGTNIISPTYVNLGITSLQVLSSTSTSVIAVVPAGLPPGAYDLRLQNPDGQATLSLNGYTSLAQIFLPLIQQDRP